MGGRYGPGDKAAPVVSNKGELRSLERVSKSENVSEEAVEPIVRNDGWSFAEVIAAHVGSNHMEAGVGQWADLMAPCPPEFGKAVKQDDERVASASRFDHVQVHMPGATPCLAPAFDKKVRILGWQTSFLLGRH